MTIILFKIDLPDKLNHFILFLSIAGNKIYQKENLVIRFLIVTIILLLPKIASASTVKGKIADSGLGKPLTGATVQIQNTNDTTEKYFKVTGKDGSFEFDKIKPGNWILGATFIGFEKLEQTVTIYPGTNELGVLKMKPKDEQLGEVRVEADAPAVKMLGDTTQYDARAYKTNPDASTEDLIKKMPGITVDNGTVKAQGEDVKKVTVDGREFFSSDPNIALRNLPAQMVDKVEVYDKLSDQAEFTGFDDGNSQKTINIVTRPEMRNGYFGEMAGGYGSEGRYSAKGSANYFNNAQKLTVLGMSNNVNDQNFSTQDLLGVLPARSPMGMPGVGRRPGGGHGRGRGMMRPGAFSSGNIDDFLVGDQNGITSTNSFGINYNDEFGGKLTLNASYFFNNSINSNDIFTNREFTLLSDSGLVYAEKSETDYNNYNHRLNARMEYKIDSKNSVIFTPSLNFQANDKSQIFSGVSSYGGQDFLNSTESDYSQQADALNFNNNLIYRRQTDTRGRTFSIFANTIINGTNTDAQSYTLSLVNTGDARNDTIDQVTNSLADSYSINARAMFTEPLGNGMLMFNYDAGYSFNHSDYDTRNYSPLTQDYTFENPLLSGEYDSDYLTQRAGGGYRYFSHGLMLMAGVNYQYAVLQGSRDFPAKFEVEKSFSNILPMAMLRWKFSNSGNLHMFYRAGTDQPSITQLNSVVDNSNPLQVNAGNPFLEQATTHMVHSRFSYMIPEKSRTFFAFFSMRRQQDYIGNSVFFAERDTILEGGIRLTPGARFTRPDNFDNYISINTNLIYGFPVKLIGSNINLNFGVNYSAVPGEVNGLLNETRTLSYNPGISIGSNISEKIDFTVSYNAYIKDVATDITTGIESDYFYQTAGVNFNWIIFDGLYIRNDVMNYSYDGLADDYSLDYTLWNIGLGYKFLKDDLADLRISVFDLLGENNSIGRNITESYIEDTRTEVLRQYFLMTFSYKLRMFD